MRRLPSYALFLRAAGSGPETRDIRYVVIDRVQYPGGTYERIPKTYRIEDLNDPDQVHAMLGGGWYRFGCYGPDHELIDWYPATPGDWLFFDGDSIPYRRESPGPGQPLRRGPPQPNPAALAPAPAAQPAQPAPTEVGLLVGVLKEILAFALHRNTAPAPPHPPAPDPIAQLEALGRVVKNLQPASPPDPLATVDRVLALTQRLSGAQGDPLAQLDRMLAVAVRLNERRGDGGDDGEKATGQIMEKAADLMEKLASRDEKSDEKPAPTQPQGQRVWLPHLGTWATLHPDQPPPPVPAAPAASVPDPIEHVAALLATDPSAGERLRRALAQRMGHASLEAAPTPTPSSSTRATVEAPAVPAAAPGRR